MDPTADSSDLYAFMSPDRHGTVTIIANYVPLQAPAGGPNFYEFSPDVLYAIHVSNSGNAEPDVTYQIQFDSVLTNPKSFLYNSGPITSLESATWNRRQFYSVTRIVGGVSTVIGRDLACPPCNIGPLSTPDYASLAADAVHVLPDLTVFAGQRAEAFYVDLGAIFDLGDLRPIEELHTTFGIPGLKLKPAPGVNSTAAVNVHSIAIRVPVSDLTAGGYVGGDVLDPRSTIGIWTTASRRKAVIRHTGPTEMIVSGPFVQESRLGNPLFNEVLVPLGRKDYWNRQAPAGDAQFSTGVTTPELAQLLPALYPGAFPNLAAFNATGAPRADLAAILLTGIPAGVVSPRFQNNTGTVMADMLRLNVSVPVSLQPNPLGVVGGDLAGYPNGRRVADDVVTIELRAIAGATLSLVDKSFVADKAITDVSDGLNGAGVPRLNSFPYLGTPYSGYAVSTAPNGQ
jgi:hypothetical protein